MAGRIREGLISLINEKIIKSTANMGKQFDCQSLFEKDVCSSYLPWHSTTNFPIIFVSSSRQIFFVSLFWPKDLCHD